MKNNISLEQMIRTLRHTDMIAAQKFKAHADYHIHSVQAFEHTYNIHIVCMDRLSS